MYRDDNGHFVSRDHWMTIIARKIINYGWANAVELLAYACRRKAGGLCAANPTGARIWLDRADKLEALREA